MLNHITKYLNYCQNLLQQTTDKVLLIDFLNPTKKLFPPHFFLNWKYLDSFCLLLLFHYKIRRKEKLQLQDFQKKKFLLFLHLFSENLRKNLQILLGFGQLLLIYFGCQEQVQQCSLLQSSLFELLLLSFVWLAGKVFLFLLLQIFGNSIIVCLNKHIQKQEKTLD